MDAANPNQLTGGIYSAKHRNLIVKRSQLPVYSVKDAFIETLTYSEHVVVVGESGAGKTTQIPQWAVEYAREKGGRKMVACTQPRRAAAISVATRVAEEMGVQLGQQVGYSIRFDDCSSDRTVLKYCTDGMMLRETMECPLLDDYDVIIIDNAHERSLHTDIQLALAMQIARNIKVVVMTSTMESAKFFQTFLWECPLIEIPPSSDCEHDEVPITPAILQSDNIIPMVLALKKMCFHHISRIDFPTKPDKGDLDKAIAQLKNLGALDENEKLTEFGALMTEFPLQPQQSAALISSVDLNCSQEVLIIISMLSAGRQVFLNDETRARFAHTDGDLLTLINVANDVDFLTLKNAHNVREQLARILDKNNLKLISMDYTNPENAAIIKKALGDDLPARCL